MGEINLTNSKGRDAVVNLQSVRAPLKVRWLDSQGRQVTSARILKSTMPRDLEALKKQAGSVEAVSQILLKNDPEVDLENFGRFLKETSRVYIDPDGKPARQVVVWEVLKNPDGSEKARRPKKAQKPNIATEIPLRWTGKLMMKKEVYNKYVFSGKTQITHVNGLTYDFLFEMAKELEEKESLMLMGGGPKGTDPLYFNRNGTAYRGFLEGKTQGDKYCLVLHLTNMELKAPAPAKEQP
jgi:hypothetical protein